MNHQDSFADGTAISFCIMIFMLGKTERPQYKQTMMQGIFHNKWNNIKWSHYLQTSTGTL